MSSATFFSPLREMATVSLASPPDVSIRVSHSSPSRSSTAGRSFTYPPIAATSATSAMYSMARNIYGCGTRLSRSVCLSDARSGSPWPLSQGCSIEMLFRSRVGFQGPRARAPSDGRKSPGPPPRRRLRPAGHGAAAPRHRGAGRYQHAGAHRTGYRDALSLTRRGRQVDTGATLWRRLGQVDHEPKRDANPFCHVQTWLPPLLPRPPGAILTLGGASPSARRVKLGSSCTPTHARLPQPADGDLPPRRQGSHTRASRHHDTRAGFGCALREGVTGAGVSPSARHSPPPP